MNKFALVRDITPDNEAILDFAEMKLASVPSSWSDELDLLKEHFCFTHDAAQRIVNAVQKMGAHTTLLQEVEGLLKNLWILQAKRCSTEPGAWISIRETSEFVNSSARENLCAYNAPRTIEGMESRLQIALKDLQSYAEEQGKGLLFHGTTWSSALSIIDNIRLSSCRSTDFIPCYRLGFYVWNAAREWAERRAELMRDDPAVLIFLTEPRNELVARKDNLSLDFYAPGQANEDEWDRMVNGCRLDILDLAQWEQTTSGYGSISGPIGKRTGTSDQPYYQRDLDTWQLAILTQRRLNELVPAMYGVVVWGAKPVEDD